MCVLILGPRFLICKNISQMLLCKSIGKIIENALRLANYTHRFPLLSPPQGPHNLAKPILNIPNDKNKYNAKPQIYQTRKK